MRLKCDPSDFSIADSSVLPVNDALSSMVFLLSLPFHFTEFSPYITSASKYLILKSGDLMNCLISTCLLGI